MGFLGHDSSAKPAYSRRRVVVHLSLHGPNGQDCTLAPRMTFWSGRNGRYQYQPLIRWW